MELEETKKRNLGLLFAKDLLKTREKGGKKAGG